MLLGVHRRCCVTSIICTAGSSSRIISWLPAFAAAAAAVAAAAAAAAALDAGSVNGGLLLGDRSGWRQAVCHGVYEHAVFRS
jgi:ABC-type sugar transport system substrate-binding protein